jgi:Uma2 family endonuclease
MIATMAPQVEYQPPGMRVVPMSRSDYEMLPEKPKAEWVKGKAYIMMAPVAFEHGRTFMRLGALLMNSLKGVDVVGDVGFRMADSDRGPDLMVFPENTASGTWVTDIPVLAAEVVSPSTRTQDYIAKAGEYARAGVGQYWIIDPKLKTITTLANDGKGGWNLITEVNADHPTAEVPVADFGTVKINLADIL